MDPAPFHGFPQACKWKIHGRRVVDNLQDLMHIATNCDIQNGQCKQKADQDRNSRRIQVKIRAGKIL